MADKEEEEPEKKKAPESPEYAKKRAESAKADTEEKKNKLMDEILALPWYIKFGILGAMLGAGYLFMHNQTKTPSDGGQPDGGINYSGPSGWSNGTDGGGGSYNNTPAPTTPTNNWEAPTQKTQGAYHNYATGTGETIQSIADKFHEDPTQLYRENWGEIVHTAQIHGQQDQGVNTMLYPGEAFEVVWGPGYSNG